MRAVNKARQQSSYRRTHADTPAYQSAPSPNRERSLDRISKIALRYEDTRNRPLSSCSSIRVQSCTSTARCDQAVVMVGTKLQTRVSKVIRRK